MKIYVDNAIAYSINAAKLDAYVTMSSGSHYVVVQSWDSTGYVQKAALNLSVGTTSSSGTATVRSKIEEMTGWQSCGSCAGPGGNGATVPYSMKQGQSSPSLDGNSAMFSIGGTSPYAAALWWKQLGASSTSKNFVYDLYFYIKNPAAAQALEFDANQSVGGHKYIMGTQCDIKDHKTWDVFDAAGGKWISTGIACPAPSAYAWHHVVLEFQRTSDNRTKFLSVTMDGKKSYINRTYSPKSSSVNELNVAFQMDGDRYMTDYSVWLDSVKFTYW